MRTSRSDTIARNFIYDAESPVISRNPTVLANSVSLDKVVSATGKGKAGSNVGTEKRPLHPDKSGSPLKKTQVVLNYFARNLFVLVRKRISRHMWLVRAIAIVDSRGDQ